MTSTETKCGVFTTAKSYMQTKYAEYNEAIKAHVNKTLPLYLYSFRVYLAYINDWKIINRSRLTQDEIDIMNQLGIYKYPKRYLAKHNVIFYI